MEETLSHKLMKIIIGFFLILNITSLVFGYQMIVSKYNGTNDVLESQFQYWTRNKNSLLDEISILSKSKKDVYENILNIKENLTFFKSKLNESILKFSTGNQQKQYYQDKLDSLQTENQELRIQEISLKAQVKNKQNQLAILQKQQQQIANRRRIRRTRAS